MMQKLSSRQSDKVSSSTLAKNVALTDRNELQVSLLGYRENIMERPRQHYRLSAADCGMRILSEFRIHGGKGLERGVKRR